MANETVDLKSEERRRQITLLLLGGLLFVTTVPVVNQRALFSPLGDVPILGDLSPVAYAATFGTPPRPGGAVGPPVARSGEAPPGAYGARTPGEPGLGGPPAGGTSLGPPPSIVGNPPLLSSPPGTPTGGNGVPGGSTPGSGTPSGGGGLPGGGGGTPGGGGTAPGVVGAVPEPGTWLTMILGFAIVGSIMRRARRQEATRRQADAGRINSNRAAVSEG
jgi:hypothetical protein